MGKTVTRYSESFKLKVVSELENGKINGICEARERYGISGGGTVQYWLRQYGKNHLLNKVVKVQTADEENEIKKLKAENKKLEKNLANLYMDFKLEEAFLKIACKRDGITVKEFKKKHELMR